MILMNDDDYVFFLFSQYCDESFVIIRKIFTVLCTFMHINIVSFGSVTCGYFDLSLQIISMFPGFTKIIIINIVTKKKKITINIASC